MERADNSHIFATQALWYLGDGRVEQRAGTVCAAAADDAIVRTLFSGVSRGTERLVCAGRVPTEERLRMRAPRQEGEFPEPVKYGYCAVGVVEAGPEALLGRAVFCLHPHQDRFAVPAAALRLLPGGLPPRRAVLAANMETALNAVWDSGAGPCDRVVVVGAGVLGLLAASLLAALPGADVTVVDVDASRRVVIEGFGAAFALPDDAPSDADVVLHASASAAGLATALAAAGQEAAVVELSWHGAGEVAVPLGGAFHSRRLKLVSSQVGAVAPSRRPRWDFARRLDAALGLLAGDPRYDLLLDREIAFDAAAAALPALLAPGADGLGIVIAYP